MKKVLRLLMLLACSYAAITHAANVNQSAVQETTLGPDGLGQLKLGMKWEKGNIVDQLVKFLENPATADGCVTGNLIAKDGKANPLIEIEVSKQLGIILIGAEKISEVDDPKGRKLAVKDWPEELRNISEDMRKFSQSIHTPEGIGIGSTEGDIKKAYTNVDIDDQMIPVPGNKKAYYQYGYDEDYKVGLIQLVRVDQDCFD